VLSDAHLVVAGVDSCVMCLVEVAQTGTPHPPAYVGTPSVRQESAIWTGEVNRLRDTRLDRITAIKALLMHLADRCELRERSEREV
jgi:hypothetical protein